MTLSFHIVTKIGLRSVARTKRFFTGPAIMTPHVYPAFLLTFVNVLGFSLLLPVLPFVVEQYGGSMAVYGALLSSYSIFQALGAPYLGKLSDSIGRKPVLMISQAGTLLSWVIFWHCLFHSQCACAWSGPSAHCHRFFEGSRWDYRWQQRRCPSLSDRHHHQGRAPFWNPRRIVGLGSLLDLGLVDTWPLDPMATWAWSSAQPACPL